MKQVMRANILLAALAVVCVASIGYCAHLGSENARLVRSSNELVQSMQKLRGDMDAWNASHPFPQDSVTAFRANYGADLLRIRYLAQLYSTDRSEANRLQLQLAIDGFAQYVHAWQQLISATAPMLNASVPRLLLSSQTGDMAQLEKALGDLDQVASQSGAELNRSITGVGTISAHK